MSALIMAARNEKEWTTEERTQARQGVCTRAAADREIRLHLVADEPGIEIPERVVRTSGEGRAVIELPKEAPATGIARLQIAGAVPLEVRGSDGEALWFSRRPPPGALRRGPVWGLPPRSPPMQCSSGRGARKPGPASAPSGHRGAAPLSRPRPPAPQAADPEE